MPSPRFSQASAEYPRRTVKSVGARSSYKTLMEKTPAASRKPKLSLNLPPTILFDGGASSSTTPATPAAVASPPFSSPQKSPTKKTAGTLARPSVGSVTPAINRRVKLSNDDPSSILSLNSDSISSNGAMKQPSASSKSPFEHNSRSNTSVALSALYKSGSDSSGRPSTITKSLSFTSDRFLAFRREKTDINLLKKQQLAAGSGPRTFDKEVLRLIGRPSVGVETPSEVIENWKLLMTQYKESPTVPYFGPILRSIMIVFKYPLKDVDLELVYWFIEWTMLHISIAQDFMMMCAIFFWCSTYIVYVDGSGMSARILETMNKLTRLIIASGHLEKEVALDIVYSVTRLIVSTFGEHEQVHRKVAMSKIRDECYGYLNMFRDISSTNIKDGQQVVFEGLVKALATESLVTRLWVLKYLTGYFPMTTSKRSLILDTGFSDSLSLLLLHLYSMYTNESLESYNVRLFQTIDFANCASVSTAGLGLLKQFFWHSSVEFSEDVYFNLFSVLIRLFVTMAKKNRTATTSEDNRVETPDTSRPTEDAESQKSPRKMSNKDTDRDREIGEIANLTRDILHTCPNRQVFDLFMDVIVEMLQGESKFENLVWIYKFAVVEINFKSEEIMSKTFGKFLFSLSCYTHVPTSVMDNARTLLSSFLLNHELLFYRPIIQCLSLTDTREVAKTVQIVAFLTDLLGETEFWFGVFYSVPENQAIESALAPSFRDLNAPQPSLTNVGLGISGLLTPRPTARVSSLYCDLLTFVVLGVDQRVFRGKEPLEASWYPTAGHIAIFTELTWSLRRLRVVAVRGYFNADVRDKLKLALHTVEAKISAFIKNKLNDFVPIGYKSLLLNFLLELRLFSDIGMRPFWLDSLVTWTIDSLKTLPKDSSFEAKSSGFLDALKLVYEQGTKFRIIDEAKSADQGSGTSTVKQKSYFLARLQFLFSMDMVDGRLQKTEELKKNDNALIKDFPLSCLTALTVLYPNFERGDVLQLLPVLWQKYDDVPKRCASKVTFLLLYCFEILPFEGRTAIFSDFYSSDPRVRLSAMSKCFSIFLERQYISYQNLPSDFPLHFGLLKNVAIDTKRYQSALRGPVLNIPFVSLDVGSDDFKSLSEPDWLTRLKDAARLIKGSYSGGLIVSKQKADDDFWGEDEDEKARDRKKRLETGLSIAPPQFFMSDDSQKEKQRFRTVLPQIYGLVGYALSDILFDAFCPIHNMSRMMILNLYRDDPTQFLRVFFNDIGSASTKRLSEIMTRLYRVILVRKRPLPSSFAYSTLNHLLGLVRWYAVEQKQGGIHIMSITIPLMTELLSSVENVGFKDFKKYKLEPILFCNGQFWFTEGQPHGMFPKFIDHISLDTSTNLYLELSDELLNLGLLRISQSNLMIQYLLRYPIEITSFRKYLSSELRKRRVTAASNGDGSNLLSYIETPLISADRIQDLTELGDLRFRANSQDRELLSLFKAGKRIWINFIDIFYSFVNRNYQEVNELGLFLHEINWCTIRFYQDTGMIRQCLAVYVNIASRFQRLFRQSGYEVFIPTLFTLYDHLYRASSFPNVRKSILFVWFQLYLVHDETFVLQILAYLLPRILETFKLDSAENPAHPSNKRTCLDSFLSLFQALSTDKHEDPLGVSHRCNVTSRQAKSDSKLFQLEDLFKLLLTIIAYEPLSRKAQQSLKFVYMLIPKLVEKHETAKVVSASIPPLVNVYAAIGGGGLFSSGRVPGLEIPAIILSKATTEGDSPSNEDAQVSSKIFLFAIIGKLSRTLKERGHAVDVLDEDLCEGLNAVLKSVVKEGQSQRTTPSTAWISAFTKDALCSIADPVKFRECAKVFLLSFAVYIRNQPKNVDLSGMLDSVRLLLAEGTHESQLSELIRNKVFLPILSAPITPDKTNLHNQAMMLKMFSKFLAEVECSHFSVVDAVERLRADPSVNFLMYVLIPFTQDLGALFHKKANKSAVYAYCLGSASVSKVQSFGRLIAYITKARPKFSNLRPADSITENPQSVYTSGTLTRRPGSVPDVISNNNNNSSPSNTMIRDKTTKFSLQLHLIVVKLAIYYAHEEFSRFSPSAWTAIALYVESLFPEDGVGCVDTAEQLTSFLAFVYSMNTPLSRMLRGFAMSRLKTLRMYASAKARKSTGESTTATKEQNADPNVLYLSPSPQEKFGTPKKLGSNRPVSVDISAAIATMLRNRGVNKTNLSKVEDAGIEANMKFIMTPDANEPKLAERASTAGSRSSSLLRAKEGQLEGMLSMSRLRAPSSSRPRTVSSSDATSYNNDPKQSLTSKNGNSLSRNLVEFEINVQSPTPATPKPANNARTLVRNHTYSADASDFAPISESPELTAKVSPERKRRLTMEQVTAQYSSEDFSHKPSQIQAALVASTEASQNNNQDDVYASTKNRLSVSSAPFQFKVEEASNAPEAAAAQATSDFNLVKQMSKESMGLLSPENGPANRSPRTTIERMLTAEVLYTELNMKRIQFIAGAISGQFDVDSSAAPETLLQEIVQEYKQLKSDHPQIFII